MVEVEQIHDVHERAGCIRPNLDVLLPAEKLPRLEVKQNHSCKVEVEMSTKKPDTSGLILKVFPRGREIAMTNNWAETICVAKVKQIYDVHEGAGYIRPNLEAFPGGQEIAMTRSTA